MLISNKTVWTPDNSFLLEYHARIECGEIIVGQELWLELERLKEDFLNDAFIMIQQDSFVKNGFHGKLYKAHKIPLLQ